MSGFEMEFPMFPTKKDMKELTQQVARDRFKVIEGQNTEKKEDDKEEE